MSKGIASIFKTYLQPKKAYEGGKGIPSSRKNKIYKLSSNENPLGQSPKATSALIEAAKNVHIYPDQTDIRLRKALVKDFNNELSENQLICGNSGSEIIDMILRAFINEEMRLFTPTPVFYLIPCFQDGMEPNKWMCLYWNPTTLWIPKEF